MVARTLCVGAACINDRRRHAIAPFAYWERRVAAVVVGGTTAALTFELALILRITKLSGSAWVRRRIARVVTSVLATVAAPQTIQVRVTATNFFAFTQVSTGLKTRTLSVFNAS